MLFTIQYYPLKEYLSKSSSIIIDLTILSHKINIRLSNPANFRQFDCNGYWLFWLHSTRPETIDGIKMDI